MSPHFLGAEEFPPWPAQEKVSKAARAGDAPRKTSHADVTASVRMFEVSQGD